MHGTEKMINGHNMALKCNHSIKTYLAFEEECTSCPHNYASKYLFTFGFNGHIHLSVPSIWTHTAHDSLIRTAASTCCYTLGYHHLHAY